MTIIQRRFPCTAGGALIGIVYMSALALLPTPSAGAAIACGNHFTSPCIASSDIRYDSAHTNDLIEQDPNWEHFAGLWKVEIKAFDGENNPPVSDPYNPTRGTGSPYDNTALVGFYNHSFSGSRFKADRLYMRGPASAEFCAQPLRPPLVNFTGNATCGENGRAYKAGFLGTSTYEKDGTLKAFRYYGSYTGSDYTDTFDTNSSSYSNIDQSSVIGSIVFQPRFSQNNAFFYLDDNYTIAEFQNAMYTIGSPGYRASTALATMYKLKEDEWLDAIDEAYDTFNVADVDRINPTSNNFECLVPGSCPTEDVWSNVGRDPNLSESPYQEPPATLKAGPIIGFCVLFFALILFAIYLLVRHRTKQQEHRFKGHFVRTICKKISIRQSVGAISPDALAKEFSEICSVKING